MKKNFTAGAIPINFDKPSLPDDKQVYCFLMKRGFHHTYYLFIAINEFRTSLFIFTARPAPLKEVVYYIFRSMVNL